MPNWCSTNYTFNFTSAEKAKAFYDLVDSWCHDVAENGFGECWLGNIVVNSGISEIVAGSEKSFLIEPYYECRGSIVFMDYGSNRVNIQTETAWSPMHDMWKAIVEKYAPDAEVIYSADECGCELYLTNDPCLEGKYIVDIMEDPDRVLDEFDSYIYDADDDTVKSVAVTLGVNVADRDVNAIISDIRNMDREDELYIGIHAWDYYDPF